MCQGKLTITRKCLTPLILGLAAACDLPNPCSASDWYLAPIYQTIVSFKRLQSACFYLEQAQKASGSLFLSEKHLLPREYDIIT